MKTRLLGGIAALLVAIIGTVLLITYVQSADQRAMAGTETSEVLVVQKAIPAGTPASEIAGSVALKPIQKSTLTEGSVTDLADLGSKVTAVSLVPGEQLLASRMVDPNSFLGPSRAAVPDGMQEVTIKLPIERVVGGKITAGDTVGIFISLTETATNGAGETQTQSSGTQLTFHKVLVTAAQFSNGSAAQPDAAQEGDGALSSGKSGQNDGTYLITVARNSVEAERLVYAIEFGKIYLSKEPTEATEGNTGVVDKTKVFR